MTAARVEAVGTPPDALLALPELSMAELANCIRSFKGSQSDPYNKELLEHLAQQVELLLVRFVRLREVEGERDALAHEVKAWRAGEETRARTVENFHARAEAAEAANAKLRELIQELIDRHSCSLETTAKLHAALNASAAKGVGGG